MIFWIVGAMVVLFAVATRLSQAGRLTHPLARFCGQPVDICVWGQPLPEAEIESVRAIGPGLHLFLRGGHLKIAQPSAATVDERTAVIDEARYVQWRGKRLPRVSGTPAVTVALR